MSEKKQSDTSQHETLPSSSQDNDQDLTLNEDAHDSSSAKWINNQGDEVKEVFGFNENAELVNARAAMFGFIMLVLTELVFNGDPVTHAIFGIG